MNQNYSILQHPTLGHEAVKNGWSWPAFLFTWIWAFVKRLFLIGWIVLLLWMALSSVPVPEAWFVGQLIISIVMGAKGNELRRKRLRASGYEEVATVEATTPERALAMHLASRGDENPIPPEGIVR
jgi:hypothetical protein